LGEGVCLKIVTGDKLLDKGQCPLCEEYGRMIETGKGTLFVCKNMACKIASITVIAK
jgi:hypothetical protein